MRQFAKHYYLLLGVFLSLIGAGLTYWQAGRMTALVDYQYQVEIAYRMFIGQVPYRDFILVLPPGLYAMIAFFMVLFGGYSHKVFLFQAVLTQILIGIASFSLFSLLLKRQKLISFLLTLIVAMTSHSMTPFPNYDITAALMILISLLIFLKVKISARAGMLLGISAVLPLLIKQTIGIGYIVSLVMTVFIITVIKRGKKHLVYLTGTVAGVIFTVSLFLLWLQRYYLIDTFIQQTFIFPSTERRTLDIIKIIITDYRNAIAFTLPLIGVIIIVAISSYILGKIHKPSLTALISGALFIVLISTISFGLWQILPGDTTRIIFGIISEWFVIFFFLLLLFPLVLLRMFTEKNIQDLPIVFLPLILLPTIHFCLLSNAVRGSHYGMWPLTLLLVAWIVKYTMMIIPAFPIRTTIGVVCVGIMIHLVVFLDQNIIVSFPDGRTPIFRADAGPIAGLSAPGPWVPNMEALFKYTQEHIPKTESVAFLPGEDPFFASTGRVPQMFCTQWEHATCNKRMEQTQVEIEKKQIQWLIIKEDLMSRWAFLPTEELSGFLQKSYTVNKQMAGYTIYRLSQ